MGSSFWWRGVCVAVVYVHRDQKGDISTDIEYQRGYNALVSPHLKSSDYFIRSTCSAKGLKGLAFLGEHQGVMCRLGVRLDWSWADSS